MWCSNCGTLLPEEARFCLTCGAPQDPRDAAAVAATPVGSIGDYDPGVCKTDLWRGYVKAEFVATVHDGDDSYELARSPAFRCRGDGPEEDDARAVAAFDALLEHLSADGWEPVAGGRPWYAYRFRRRFRDVLALPGPATTAARSRRDDAEETGS